MQAQEIQPHFEGAIVGKISFKEEVASGDHTEAYVDAAVAGDYVEQDEDEEGVAHLEEVIIEETIDEDEDQMITMANFEDGIDEEDEEAMEHDSGSEEGEEEEEVDTDYEDFSPQSKRAPRVKSEKKQLRELVTAENREKENELIRQMIILACSDCGFLSDTFENLIYHYRDVHKKSGGLTCCNRLFVKRLRVVDHAKLHADPNAFACPVCAKPFCSRYSLSNHKSAHVPEELCEFQCAQCPKKYE